MKNDASYGVLKSRAGPVCTAAISFRAKMEAAHDASCLLSLSLIRHECRLAGMETCSYTDDWRRTITTSSDSLPSRLFRVLALLGAVVTVDVGVHPISQLHPVLLFS